MKVTIVPFLLHKHDQRTGAKWTEEYAMSYVCLNGKSVGYIDKSKPRHFLPLADVKKDKSLCEQIVKKSEGLLETCDGIPELFVDWTALNEPERLGPESNIAGDDEGNRGSSVPDSGTEPSRTRRHRGKM